MKIMAQTIADAIKTIDYVKDRNVSVKVFKRPDTLQEIESSIVIIPLSPPRQVQYASNTTLAKRFEFQINVETTSYKTTKQLSRYIEQALLDIECVQLDGGLDEYFEETGRYVDARHYRIYSKLYDVDY